mmetsp:Transcript_1665/g.2383  ORF Transcript_1665/g.2383 Transcript_1665/m.2383 type:complete len:303 (+) Transcript_1665:567-1475(+)
MREDLVLRDARAPQHFLSPIRFGVNNAPWIIPVPARTVVAVGSFIIFRAGAQDLGIRPGLHIAIRVRATLADGLALDLSSFIHAHTPTRVLRAFLAHGRAVPTLLPPFSKALDISIVVSVRGDPILLGFGIIRTGARHRGLLASSPKLGPRCSSVSVSLRVPVVEPSRVGLGVAAAPVFVRLRRFSRGDAVFHEFLEIFVLLIASGLGSIFTTTTALGFIITTTCGRNARLSRDWLAVAAVVMLLAQRVFVERAGLVLAPIKGFDLYFPEKLAAEQVVCVPGDLRKVAERVLRDLETVRPRQ